MFSERTLHRRTTKDLGQECRGSKPTDSVLSLELIPYDRFAHTEDELHVLCKCTTYNNIRPDLLRRDSRRGSVSYLSGMQTNN